MDSFEDIGTSPEFVEALASEGFETPTPLQEAALPLLRKGNNVILAAGPGSGLLVAWGVPLLERIDVDGAGPSVLVVTTDRTAAQRQAESLARLAQPAGLAIAALGSPWALPDRAHVLFGTPEDVLTGLRTSVFSGARVQSLVIDQAQAIEHTEGLEGIEQILPFLPADTQRVISALPLSPGVSDFAGRHLKRAVTVPALHDPTGLPKRGEVRYRIVTEPAEDALPILVDQLLAEDHRHVLVFCRSEDQAADVGDRLTLRGFVAGAPGDESVPVWLAVDALEARERMRSTDGVVAISCDVPADPDTLDRRHGISDGGVVLVLARQVAHLKDVANRTGYTLTPLAASTPPGSDRVRALRDTLESALRTEDLGPYLYALAPVFEHHDPAEVAAAAVALLRKRGTLTDEARPTPQARSSASTSPAATPAWAKLFVTVGSRDGLVPGDLLGAVTGEAGVAGEAVGRIDIKESHSVIEVHDVVAAQVIKALNGKTIRGRAVRADFDRPRKSASAGARRRVPRT